jgi:hypothetical protein
MADSEISDSQHWTRRILLTIRHYRLYGVDMGLVQNPDVTAKDTRATPRLVPTKGVVTVFKTIGKALEYRQSVNGLSRSSSGRTGT